MTTRFVTGVRRDIWRSFIDQLRTSPNEYEREAIYLGTVAADGSPILVDRSQLREHAHFLGSTGAGKSAMGLSPLIEQLISFGDSTLIILDLKGDSNELLAGATSATENLARRTGVTMPVKVFTLERGKATCAMNPLATPTWKALTSLQRTDILCSACGLYYGTDYGRAFFTSSNSSLIHQAESIQKEQCNFRTLHNEVLEYLTDRHSTIQSQDLRRAGIHVYQVLTRLASIPHLNHTPDETPAIDSIVFEDMFRQPQVAYFRLPSSINQDTSGAIGRLVSQFLIAAAHHVSKRRQVYLIIDEFQRMAAEGLSMLFEQARSMDISLILSNQSIKDLGRHSSALLNVIETNCNLRQWFSAAAVDDLLSIERLSGHHEVDEVSTTVTYSTTSPSTKITTRKRKEARISLQQAIYVSNDPNMSVIRITGVRRGYSHYRGLPFISSCRFHISEAEYHQRRDFPWPELRPGLVLASEEAPTSKTKPARKAERSRPVLPKVQHEPTSGGIEFSDWSPEGI